MGLFDNIKKRGFKDILNPHKIKLYIRSIIWDKRGIGIKPKESLDFSEMVIYRSNMCPHCTKAGKCIGTNEIEGCYCPTPELFADPESSCVANIWGSYKKDNWVEEFRKDKKLMQLKIVSKFG